MAETQLNLGICWCGVNMDLPGVGRAHRHRPRVTYDAPFVRPATPAVARATKPVASCKIETQTVAPIGRCPTCGRSSPQTSTERSRTFRARRKNGGPGIQPYLQKAPQLAARYAGEEVLHQRLPARRDGPVGRVSALQLCWYALRVIHGQNGLRRLSSKREQLLILRIKQRAWPVPGRARGRA